MTNQTVQLTAPVTVTLSPATIVACMDGMAELPYHTANPAIRELEAQILAATQPKEPS